MQGQTVHKPTSLVTCFKKVFAAAMSYVSLSRVTALEQLIILDKLYPEKIYPNKKALKALEELENKALNNMFIGRCSSKIRIVYLNVQNLNYHVHDVQCDHKLKEHNLILLGETWVQNNEIFSNQNQFAMKDYEVNYCNIGNGKGMIGHSEAMFRFAWAIRKPTYQVLKYDFEFFHSLAGVTVPGNVIGLYRSSGNCMIDGFLEDLTNVLDTAKICIILGDFNICSKKDAQHRIIKALHQMGFKQLIDSPTHVQGGIIDHFYILVPEVYDFVQIEFELFSPYYSDHYGISVSLRH